MSAVHSRTRRFALQAFVSLRMGIWTFVTKCILEIACLASQCSSSRAALYIVTAALSEAETSFPSFDRWESWRRWLIFSDDAVVGSSLHA